MIEKYRSPTKQTGYMRKILSKRANYNFYTITYATVILPQFVYVILLNCARIFRWVDRVVKINFFNHFFELKF